MRFGGGWSPLRYPVFRRLWLAQFTSNVGSWMQTVAAQWVMTSLTGSTLLLSAIPAAGSIPVLLLAVPAGTLGDLVDRRTLILAAQAGMLIAASVLALGAAEGWLTPWLLLGLLFAIGVGGAASAATWQTLQPELVTADERPQAIALGSVNQNLARAVGPAIGGVLLAATSAAVVFLANAVSFVAVVVAVAVTVVPRRPLTLPREHAAAAVRAGGRFVRNSPVLLSLIVRSIAFVFFAGAVWALLPVIARQRLGLGSAGYGLLLACVGVGAIVAATFGPSLRRVLAARSIYALACLVIAGSAAVLAVTHSVALVAVALVAAGACWIMGLGLLGAAYQGQLPDWVKARGVSYYLVAFQGSVGIGSLAVGGIAQATNVSTAFTVVACSLAAAAILTWRVALPNPVAIDHQLTEPLPLPDSGTTVDDGPVTVTVTYRLAAGNADAFLALAPALRGLRRRTGATRWQLHHELEDRQTYTETFLVGSWAEHERQHARIERGDSRILEQIDTLLQPGNPRTAHHALGVRTHRGRRSHAQAPSQGGASA
jgi:MFS family permease